ncbi:DUF3048 domain-containing protein [Patescibacteria group bacterium]|nr:DUF3048 domain-containing protein [Patescibacteria group bacterium]
MLKNKKTITIVLGCLALYLASSGISYAAFRYLNGGVAVISPEQTEDARAKIDLSAPKTEECPLNGEMFTKQERAIWETKRPLTIMIENHSDSRPQSGLLNADVVYEVIAEGGITRFMGVFYCGASAEDVIVGPVRSARTYFLDFASEYGDYPLYVHVGGANKPGKTDALGQIGDYGWLNMGNDMNQFSLGFPTFWRDYERLGREVATEHTVYSSTDKLWEVAVKRDLNAKDEEGNLWNEDFVSWEFEDSNEAGDVLEIAFDFWNGYKEYSVKWQFDSELKAYKRFNGEVEHKDLNKDSQIQAKNIVVQFVKETGPVNELKHMLYGVIGEGKALVFKDGNMIKANWSKLERQSRTIFTDSTGDEIAFSRGPVWIEVLPLGQEVNY